MHNLSNTHSHVEEHFYRINFAFQNGILLYILLSSTQEIDGSIYHIFSLQLDENKKYTQEYIYQCMKHNENQEVFHPAHCDVHQRKYFNVLRLAGTKAKKKGKEKMS